MNECEAEEVGQKGTNDLVNVAGDMLRRRDLVRVLISTVVLLGACYGKARVLYPLCSIFLCRRQLSTCTARPCLHKILPLKSAARRAIWSPQPESVCRELTTGGGARTDRWIVEIFLRDFSSFKEAVEE